MDLRRLEVFCKVYELKSFSRAGKACLLSQPTVSEHIRHLETHLNVRLFDRLGREVAPTRAGEILYNYARRMLNLKREASLTLLSRQARPFHQLGAIAGECGPH